MEGGVFLTQFPTGEMIDKKLSNYVRPQRDSKQISKVGFRQNPFLLVTFLKSAPDGFWLILTDQGAISLPRQQNLF